MSDAVQMPPSMPVVPRVAPVHPAEHIEPPKKAQTENHHASDHQQEGRDAAAQAVLSAADRHLRISKDDAAQSFVYRSVEAETGKVVWQWPAEQILRRAQYLREAEERMRHEGEQTAVDQKA